MSFPGVSSLEYDIEKAFRVRSPERRSESPSITGKRLSRHMSGTPIEGDSKHYSNFSRPSVASLNSFEHTVQRRRSSDDLSEKKPPRRRQYSDMSPMSPTGSVPVFARAAIEANVLRDPPPVRNSSPAPTTASHRTRSMDVLEAVARDNTRWESNRSLVSIIREQSKHDSSTFAQRVFESGKADLLYDLHYSKRWKDRKEGMLDLTTLQRMSQHVSSDNAHHEKI
jgi:hypothetical protein